MPTYTHKFNKSSLVRLLQQDGPFATCFDSFEERITQQDMMGKVVDSFLDSKVSIIEAGTGIGKSMAYLIPAIYWSLNNNCRVVISTHTITLQEQLLFKDIPLIQKALGLEFEAVLVKGMGNYLCLRKLDEELSENFADTNLEMLGQWSGITEEGSLSDIDFSFDMKAWDKVKCEREACPYIQCPHFKRCFFFKERKKAEKAHLLIVNHHLLLSDLKWRESDPDESKKILPDYEHVIIDEAHTLEDVATDVLASRVSFRGLKLLFSKLFKERQGHPGYVNRLKEKLQVYAREMFEEEALTWIRKCELDLRHTIDHILEMASEAFGRASSFFHKFAWRQQEDLSTLTRKCWVSDPLFHHREFQEIKQAFEEVTIEINRSLESIRAYIEEMDLQFSKTLLKKLQSIRVDILSITEKLSAFAENLSCFFHSRKSIKWVEENPKWPTDSLSLCETQLDFSSFFAKQLFNNFASSIICSATLSTHQNFTFIRNRLGLNPKLIPQKNIDESVFESPFDYENQTVLAIPKDISSPYEWKFIAESHQLIQQLVHISLGNAFVLFTSFQALDAAYEALSSDLLEAGFTLFKQGEQPRGLLLERFKEAEKSILFGTDTFWEGVDVSGDALRLVIIVKLPFKVPTEPINQARSEYLKEQGLEPFRDYAVPKAIVKFKQGFGRLIRTKQDQGAIVCLDNRLISKNYGKYFLKSLPTCALMVEKQSKLIEGLQKFYQLDK